MEVAGLAEDEDWLIGEGVAGLAEVEDVVGALPMVVDAELEEVVTLEAGPSLASAYESGTKGFPKLKGVIVSLQQSARVPLCDWIPQQKERTLKPPVPQGKIVLNCDLETFKGLDISATLVQIVLGHFSPSTHFCAHGFGKSGSVQAPR